MSCAIPFFARVAGADETQGGTPSSPASADIGKPSSPPQNPEQEASELSTGKDTRSIQLRDGTSLTLAPESLVRRHGTVPIAVGLKGAAPRAYAIELVRGAISVEVSANKRPFYRVLVRAPRKVAALVRTGRATVQSAPSATVVAARSGLDMTVAVAEFWRVLHVGRSFSVSDSAPSGAQQQLHAAPDLAVDRAVVLPLGLQIPAQRLRWANVEASVAYRLRIFRHTDGNPTLHQERLVHALEADVTGLEPGRYFASVTAIDENGVESDPSKPAQLRVLAARLPDGAYATPAAIHLPARARLRLLHTDGLEMTYGAGNGLFVPVPETVGLHDGQPVRIRVREKGSLLDTPLYLEPLGVQPHIVFEPASATWPGAPIGVRIALQTSSGKPYPDENAINASVTVNTRTASAKWLRLPGMMSTRIQEPPDPGPWVLRVVVYDASGHELARDFLEVAQRPRTSARGGSTAMKPSALSTP